MNATDVARHLCRRAAEALQAGNAELALGLYAKAKGQKIPCEGMDLGRALAFLTLNQTHAAYESLKEELRFFPGNAAARELLPEMEKLCRQNMPPDADADFLGLYGIIAPYTMVWPQRLYALYQNASLVCAAKKPGNFVECGVAGGGSSALLAAIIKRKAERDVRLFCCDSFSGMPTPTRHDRHAGIEADATGWGAGTCAAPESSLLEACAKVEATDCIEIVKGYFCDTLPALKERMAPIAFLHMDGDWYESTRDILAHLYDCLSPGAYVQVDDYGHWDGCRKALHEFERERGLNFALNLIDASGVWFVKP